jgi:hypothetical protein
MNFEACCFKARFTDACYQTFSYILLTVRFSDVYLSGFLIYFSYGSWHKPELIFHDNLSLSSLQLHPHTEIDELFDDIETEINVYVDHTSDEDDR